MKSLYLHKDDIQAIVQFMNAFPDCNTVELTADDSSGIGTLINAHIHHVDLNGMRVTVTKEIVDESSW